MKPYAISPECLDLADKICLDTVALASTCHYIHHYGGKISDAELQSSFKNFKTALKQHQSRCNELMCRLPL